MPAPKGTRPPAAGKGRPKGAKNKMSGALKDMIIGALDDAGGQQYLVEQATKNPAAFMTLLGKLLPMTLAGDAKDPNNAPGDPQGRQPEFFRNRQSCEGRKSELRGPLGVRNVTAARTSAG
jgi:hypothetical protein